MQKLTKDVIQWIKDYFKDNHYGKIICGVSGGKDSTITAALCVEALGADRVIGVMLPNGVQKDIDDSLRVCYLLNIPHMAINIGGAVNNLCYEIDCAYDPLYECSKNPMIKTNLPARIRMATLYAVAALYPNSRVVNTCNFSEDYVGYSTKYGDAAGDFSPLGRLTVREVLQIGDDLGLPYELVHKTPSDGMCGKTDEDNLGFTYEELDSFLLDFKHPSPEKYKRIMQLHNSTRHKYNPMPMFNPGPMFNLNEEEMV